MARNGAAPRVAVVNLDDVLGLEIAEAAHEAGAEIFGYGMGAADFRAEEVEMSASGMRFTMATPHGSGAHRDAADGQGECLQPARRLGRGDGARA